MSGREDTGKAVRAEDKRRLRFWRLVNPAVSAWVKRSFRFSYDDFEPADIEGPVIVAINHASAYDPIFTAVAFRNKPLTFIASEHILRNRTWGNFLNEHLRIIPHKKGARGSRTALVAIKRIRKGESVFLAVEGEQTWNGRPLPVMPYTGKLVKSSGATLVNYVLEGAYLSAPRWSFSARKGKVYGHPAGIYGPDVLKEMSDEEVEQLIAKDLAFDTWKWQESQPDGPVRFRCLKGGSADGLERSVFSCPECGEIGRLRSDGDHIGCSCGFKVRLEDTGFFAPPAPFRTVCEWEELDKKKLAERMEAVSAAGKERAGAAEELFADDGVVLHRIEEGHSDEEAARGTLSLVFSEGSWSLIIGDFSFDLENLSNMTMVLASRIVFSDKSGYYELHSQKKSRTNLRKYVIARNILTGE